MFSAEYLAGLFDGEGYVTMHGRNDGYVMCYIGMVMHNKTILEKLLQQFPESVMYEHDRNNKLSNSVGLSWRINSRSAKAFVDLIYPYCVLKQEDLNWYYDWYNLSKSSTAGLTAEVRKERIELINNYKKWRASKKA